MSSIRVQSRLSRKGRRVRPPEISDSEKISATRSQKLVKFADDDLGVGGNADSSCCFNFPSESDSGLHFCVLFSDLLLFSFVDEIIHTSCYLDKFSLIRLFTGEEFPEKLAVSSARRSPQTQDGDVCLFG